LKEACTHNNSLPNLDASSCLLDLTLSLSFSFCSIYPTYPKTSKGFFAHQATVAASTFSLSSSSATADSNKISLTPRLTSFSHWSEIIFPPRTPPSSNLNVVFFLQNCGAISGGILAGYISQFAGRRLTMICVSFPFSCVRSSFPEL